MLARRIAFLDREAAIASPLAFCLRRRERDVGSNKREQLLGSTDRAAPEIPAGVSRKRYSDVGEAKTTQGITVTIDLRDQQRQGCSSAISRQEAVQSTHAREDFSWRADAAHCRERRIGGANESAVLETRVAAWGRRHAVAHPFFHVHDQRAPRRPLIQPGIRGLP